MAAKILFSLASFFTRQSLLCFYYRLVSDSGMRKFRLAIHISTVFNISIVITFVFLCVFLCTPIRAYWIFPPTGRCLDEGKVTLAGGAINCVADLLITTLPIPMVMRLKMRLRQRLVVSFLLGLGFIVTIAGIVRTYFIWMAFMDSYDETWYSYPLWIAAAVEVDLALITACAPSLKPLILIYARPLITSVSKRSRTGTQEPSNLESHGLDFGVLNADSDEHAENIDLKQLPESASDSSEIGVAPATASPLDGNVAKQHHALTIDAPAPAPLAIQIRRSIEISHSDGPFGARSSPVPLARTPQPSTTRGSPQPASSPRRPSSSRASSRASPFGRPSRSSPDSGASHSVGAANKAKAWNWPLREELVSRYVLGGSEHGASGSVASGGGRSGASSATGVSPRALPLAELDQVWPAAARVDEGGLAPSTPMGLGTAWLSDQSSSGAESDAGGAEERRMRSV